MDQWLASFEEFMRSLKRGGKNGTYELCLKVSKYIMSLLEQKRLKSVKDIKNSIQLLNKFIELAQRVLPLEITISNIIRRILHIIREEASHRNLYTASQKGQITTLTALFNRHSKPEDSEDISELQEFVKAEVRNLIEELETHEKNISDQALNHINNNEIILTYGFSNTVLNFLKKAHKAGRKFEVLVGESAPLLSGHTMSKALASEGIDTTLITDSSVFALMSRVSKVIIGTRAIMANGGLLTEAGNYGVCLSAQAHCVPVLVTCALYKLSPLYPFDQDTFNEYLSPFTIADKPEFDEVEFINYNVPAFDYIPPELISLYVTDVGGKMNSYLYRLLSEYYSAEDYSSVN
jgi:translation initiation factor eIF-2B subunit beta